MADVLWTPESLQVAAAREWIERHYELDIDGFLDLALACKQQITDEAEIYGVRVQETVAAETLEKQARQQFADAAIETAIDSDSISAVVEQLC
jgi:hypothetical protein